MNPTRLHLREFGVTGHTFDATYLGYIDLEARGDLLVYNCAVTRQVDKGMVEIVQTFSVTGDLQAAFKRVRTEYWRNYVGEVDG